MFLPILRTCYYALCLIAKTKRGVEQLKQLGWVSVCHSHEHKWPVVNKSVTFTPYILRRNIVKEKAPFQHQASLPAVVLTSTDNAESSAAARRKALFKKSTSTMGAGKILHHQRIIEDKVSEYVSEDQPLQVGSLVEQPAKMRCTNSSSQQRPLSMMSLSNK